MSRTAKPGETPIVLCIMDGFGIAPPGPNNAIHVARTPNWDRFRSTAPTAQLSASAGDVGLPRGQFGNSEVGHLNMGAGRVVYQDIQRITLAIKDGSIYQNEALVAAFRQAAQNGTAVHLFGLVSDGGVHSHIDHLPALLEMARRENLDKVFLHAFLDGRDTPPRSALKYVPVVERMFAESGRGTVATVSGRYYAMDRDKRWDRTAMAYRMLTEGEGREASSFGEAIEKAYAEGEDDEFVKPTVIRSADGHATARIEDGDTCICFNFRPDRVRQITQALVFDDCPCERPVRAAKLHYVCLTQYSADFDLPVAFPPHPVTETLGDVYAAHGLGQLRLAETEKYAHVTYFFSGGREEPLAGEERLLVPSNKEVATYDHEPAMRAREVTAKLEEALAAKPIPLVVMNLANPDMVGHTGVMAATVRAIEVIDECLGRIERAVEAVDGILLVTSDHGNAEQMWDEENHCPHTAHTSNPVPLVLLGPGMDRWRLSAGVLADVAPTILTLAGLPIPEVMSGCNLVESGVAGPPSSRVS
jgi:2,3-bisphosphoglycerate-independent phosphoglycerate mutase